MKVERNRLPPGKLINYGILSENHFVLGGYVLRDFSWGILSQTPYDKDCKIVWKLLYLGKFLKGSEPPSPPLVEKFLSAKN